MASRVGRRTVRVAADGRRQCVNVVGPFEDLRGRTYGNMFSLAEACKALDDEGRTVNDLLAITPSDAQMSKAAAPPPTLLAEGSSFSS
jgi:hypothetical protein